jgi:hypothetical protein
MRLRRRAVSGGLSALVFSLCAGCAGTGAPPKAAAIDTLVVQASSAARRAYEQGDYAQAQTLYRRALVRAQAIDDAELAANAAYNLAIAEVGLRNYDTAGRLLRQAQFDAARASSGAFDIHLLRAKVAYLRHDLSEAVALANDILASRAATSLRVQAQILRAQISAESGDLSSANSDLRAIDIVASRSALSPSIRADLAKLNGTIAERSGKMDAAARFFDTEGQLLQSAQRYRDRGNALARAAAAHLAAGGPALAADRYFLAARSLNALGDVGAAKALAASSLSAATQAGDENARARAQSLQEEIAKGGGP